MTLPDHVPDAVLPWAAALALLSVLGMWWVVRGVRYRAARTAARLRHARGAGSRALRVLLLTCLIGGAQFVGLALLPDPVSRAAVLLVPALITAARLSASARIPAHHVHPRGFR
ncbi:hypothetical protein [Umezawaea tangerina]|uniref:Uncharacterized protein n=1 Tax=Umezawaea tangerina TaxID=84725 RepID=A0A2T0SS80_9PSEU|nr:hypothetical protein [Umezawaea tangerina]PRY36272.1 hypothetical protein CLV43_112199 [Umezawaea tangerina]